MTHALINVFSQMATGGNEYVQFVCRIVIIVMAVFIANQERRNVRCG